MNKKGFTLVEIIIYVALVSIILVTAILFLWQVMDTRSKSNAYQEVQQNARLAIGRMTAEIRGASDVIKTVGDSTFNVNPGKLTLDYATDVVFDTYVKSITVGGQSVDITKLRVTDASGAVDLTSDKVNVTNFVLTDLTRGSEADNIKINLTVARVNPGGDMHYDASVSVETAVSLRR